LAEGEPDSMKVLFINHKDIEGGAAIAAYRLAQGLEKYHGAENTFIVAKKSSGDTHVFTAIDKKSETMGKTMVFIEFLVDRIMNKLGMQYCYFPFSSRSILKKARQIKPDIISLHNTHGGYFKTSLIKKLSRIAPVVWTLHDMWAFTASAAHTFGNESWKLLKSSKEEKYIYPHIGWNRGRWLLKRKRRIYAKSNLHIVTPSHWLEDLARQSPVFKNKPVSHIFHGVDLETFRPLDKLACRKALGLPENAKLVMFSSADDLGKSAWKGGQLLLDILAAIDDGTREPIDAMVLGKGELTVLKNLKHLKVHRMGYVRGDRLIPVLLSAADLVIYPTRADNLSLVLLEAIACGTPCVTFDVGGCGDMIKNDINGYLIKPFACEFFAEKTLEILNNPHLQDRLSHGARTLAEKHFSLTAMAANYDRMFKKILEHR